jgi:glycerate 2-kinase
MIKNLNELINNGIGVFKKFREDILFSIDNLFEEIDPEKIIEKNIYIENNKLNIFNEILNLNDFNRIFLFSFGKASIKMAKGVLSKLNVYKGVVVSNIDYKDFPENIEYIKGEHPILGEGSLIASQKIVELANETEENDLSIVLISGGGSSMVELPIIPLEDYKSLIEILLKKGLNIEEINIIRKHLSKIKGGKLLNYLKGKVYSLIISDVIGDDFGTIASGPTYFDKSTFLDAYEILKKYEILKEIPGSVVEVIEKGINGKISETLKESDFPKNRVKNFIILSNHIACKILEKNFKEKGYNTFYLGSRIQGEAREVAKVLGGIAVDIHDEKVDLKKPLAMIFGGETTVTVKGNGKGGRNSELTLAISPFLSNKNIIFTSFGTDGIDGITDSSGAICDGNTIKRAESLNLNYKEYLLNNDSYSFFKELNDLIFTGPTQNNVMDIGVIVIF